MKQFFHVKIENWSDWGCVFQSIPAFDGLIREIFRREALPCSGISNLTPGTNAVFRVGDYVIKIFFPMESGLDPLPDFQNEAAVCGRLADLDVPMPRLVAQGEIQDSYHFYYLISEYFRGQEAGNFLSTASREQKLDFIQQLQRLLQLLNRPADGLIAPVDLLDRAVNNPRLDKLPSSLAKEMRQRARSLLLSPRVLVHGDLTGENLLVDRNGRLAVIDCADACLAPSWYELAPLVIELFRCDAELLRAFSEGNPLPFLKQTLDSLCLHDFGASLLLELQKREKIKFTHLEEVEKFLLGRVS